MLFIHPDSLQVSAGAENWAVLQWGRRGKEVKVEKREEWRWDGAERAEHINNGHREGRENPSVSLQSVLKGAGCFRKPSEKCLSGEY